MAARQEVLTKPCEPVIADTNARRPIEWYQNLYAQNKDWFRSVRYAREIGLPAQTVGGEPIMFKEMGTVYFYSITEEGKDLRLDEFEKQKAKIVSETGMTPGKVEQYVEALVEGGDILPPKKPAYGYWWPESMAS